MKWCAGQEIKKATTEIRKKRVGELCLLRSYRNQLRDVGVVWMHRLRAFGLLPKRKE
jgi:hypothetical protein